VQAKVNPLQGEVWGHKKKTIEKGPRKCGILSVKAPPSKTGRLAGARGDRADAGRAVKLRTKKTKRRPGSIDSALGHSDPSSEVRWKEKQERKAENHRRGEGLDDRGSLWAAGIQVRREHIKRWSVIIQKKKKITEKRGGGPRKGANFEREVGEISKEKSFGHLPGRQLLRISNGQLNERGHNLNYVGGEPGEVEVESEQHQSTANIGARDLIKKPLKRKS